jgi:hypothetical protein
MRDPVAFDIALACPKSLVTLVPLRSCRKALFSVDDPPEYSFDGSTAITKRASLAKYGGLDDNSCQVGTGQRSILGTSIGAQLARRILVNPAPDPALTAKPIVTAK